jgi:hypothetical protein
MFQKRIVRTIRRVVMSVALVLGAGYEALALTNCADNIPTSSHCTFDKTVTRICCNGTPGPFQQSCSVDQYLGGGAAYWKNARTGCWNPGADCTPFGKSCF